jgi:Protein of unknown function (DUF2829)
MDFSEALLLLKTGKKVRRAHWEGTADRFLNIVHPDFTSPDPLIMVWACHDESGQPHYYIWGGYNFDILADDWEEVQDEPSA